MLDPSIADRIRKAQEQLLQKYKLLREWGTSIRSIRLTSERWVEESLVKSLPLPRGVEKQVISAVDGGIVFEELRAFDVILTRAVGVTFTGAGKKIEASYTPSFSPRPNSTVISEFASRLDFAKYASLKRLEEEYNVALATLKEKKPNLLILDGSVHPLSQDLQINQDNQKLVTLKLNVLRLYHDLVREALNAKTILLGIVKDSRSRSFTELLTHEMQTDESSPKYMQVLNTLRDFEVTSVLLPSGTRTAWYKTGTSPNQKFEYAACMIRPITDDDPVRVETILYDAEWFTNSLELGLGSVYTLCQHGLPLSLPTIILEADKRTRIPKEELNEFIRQLAAMLSIPPERLKKRRSLPDSLDHRETLFFT